MSYQFSGKFVFPSEVQFRHSGLHGDVLVLEIKPVGREKAVVRCLVTTVFLKELACCKMWEADGYKFPIRFIGTDVSERCCLPCRVHYCFWKWNTVRKDAALSSEASLYSRPHSLWPSAAVWNTGCTWRVSGRTLGEELSCLVCLLLRDWNSATSLYSWYFVGIWTARVWCI
jgi:hypothetical protein